MFYGSEGVALSVEQVSPVEYIFPASENVDLSNLMGIALPHTLAVYVPERPEDGKEKILANIRMFAQEPLVKKGGKKYMARKTDNEKKTHLVTVRLTSEEYEILCEGAKEAGMSKSEYLRHMTVFGKVDVHVHIDVGLAKLEEIGREFSRIGNNLNQLTRYFNAGGPATMEMYAMLTHCINQLMEMRSTVMELGGEVRGCLKAPG